MQKIKVLIVEDEWIVSEELKELLVKHDFEVIGQAEDANAAMELAAANTPDILLTDINIKGDKDGIELAAEFIKKYNCAVIFLTAYYDDHFLRRAKRVDPAAYIIKPFEERNLIVAIDLAFSKLSATDDVEDRQNHNYLLNDRIFVRDKHKFVRLDIEDIVFIEADGSYSKIVTIDSEFTLAINLTTLEEKIDHPSFFRIHRSYLVNMFKIEGLAGNLVEIKHHSLPVSLSHREELAKRLKLI
ncbi:MAG: DNA-binding LytR/AlgR family response regulator [Cyclobacteriaceae bacterium]|jgi:DNA-binding LytR/AlgR family response regulator